MNDYDAETDGGWFSAEHSTFGDRLAGARQRIPMTQIQLSERLGVKLKTIRSWEDDITEPRANRLQKLSGLLNVSVMWLLNGEGDGIEGPAEEQQLESDVVDLLTEIRDLKTQLGQSADRLGLLEKRLRAKLKDQLQ